MLTIEIDIEVTATKIIREPAIVTEVNGEYHPNDYNLVYELAQHIPNDYPHCYIIKIPKSDDTTALNGADAYYTSDGSFYETNQTHTWNDSATNKISRYIIYAFAARNCDVLFSTLGVTAINELMFDDVTVGTITMSGSSTIISRVFGTDKTIIDTLSNSAFSNVTKLCSFDLPVKNYGTQCFLSCANLTSWNYSECQSIGYQSIINCNSLLELNLIKCKSIDSYFQNTSIKKIRLPVIETLSSPQGLNCTGLEYLYLGKSLLAFTSGVFASAKPNLKNIELESGFDTTVDFRYATGLLTANIYDYIIPNLKDNTGVTAKTITFATAVYNNLVAAGYIALFTPKNWNVAAI